MSIPNLFIARKSSTMYQLFYSREVQTDALTFYKISPAHIAIFKNLDDFTPPHKHSTAILLRHWEGDTILESKWQYTDSKASIERPDGLLLSNLPILSFEKAADVLPFKSCFIKTFVQVTHPIPLHVRKIVLEDAIRKAEVCSISFEPITMKSLVTSCGHVFQEEAIQKWLSNPSSNRLCPICKQTCCI
jgi:hypothetical protein